MISEYSWVLNVLDSCKTEEQIKTSENLFNLFLNKWEEDISDIKKIDMTHKFNKLKNYKKNSLK